jgi:hypothetical protein
VAGEFQGERSMETFLEGFNDGEMRIVAERLIRHLNVTFHPYIIAALGAALAVLDDEAEDESEIEDILSESCQVFYEFTIAFMHRVGEAEQEKIWLTSIHVGREIYGDERTRVAAGLTLEYLKESGTGDESDEDIPPIAPTLN